MDKQKLTGNERLQSEIPELHGSTILDFWQWAFSDLQANNLRGVFAEWLVAKLVGASLDRARDSWREFDLEISSDPARSLKIEVKAAAYLQSWGKDGEPPSKIIFSSLKNKVYDYNTKQYTDAETYNADVYVFCLQHQMDRAERWEARNMENWSFFVLPREKLEPLNVKSIGLASLEKLTDRVHARELRNCVQACSGQTNTHNGSLSGCP